LYSRSGNTPFAGWTLHGRVLRTFVEGKLVHELKEEE
jgi:dihydroorotase-like cyclic amidohydrolase